MGWQQELVDAVVEEQPTKTDELCHEIREIESKEVEEDGLRWPCDGSEGGVEPGYGGDDGYDFILNFGVDGEQIGPKSQPHEDLEQR